MNKTLKYLSVIIASLILFYFLGPKAKIPNLTTELPTLTNNLSKINDLIITKNSNPNIRDDNHSRLIWIDSVPKKTNYSIVYLHGFSASPGECEVIYKSLSKRYNANLYAPRLFQHGLKAKEPLLNFTAKDFLNSTKEALAIGKQIGDKVILVCTSTGATAGLFLASEHPEIEALVLFSPNIDIYDTKSNLITKPWGKQILKTVLGGNYQTWQPPIGAEKYWYSKYRIEAIIQLKSLIQTTMKQTTFEKIHQPMFMAYYYKDEENQDKTVSVKRMLDMFNQVKTPINKKVKIAIPDAKNHSLASRFFTSEYKTVQKESFKFLDTILKKEKK